MVTRRTLHYCVFFALVAFLCASRTGRVQAAETTPPAPAVQLTRIVLDPEDTAGATTNAPGAWTTSEGTCLCRTAVYGADGSLLNKYTDPTFDLGEISLPLSDGRNTFTLYGGTGVFPATVHYGAILFFDGKTSQPQISVHNANGGTTPFLVQPAATTIMNGTGPFFDQAPGSSVYTHNGKQVQVESFTVDSVNGAEDRVGCFLSQPDGTPDTKATLVLNVSNVAPGLSSLGPQSTAVGNPDLTVTVLGSDFVSSSVVRWFDPATNASTDLATNYVSPTTLNALVPAALIGSTPRTVEMRVFNPAPGGGISSPLPFTVREQSVPIAEDEILATGVDHACALRPDGSIDCWGGNNNGQAADQPGPFTRVVAGPHFTCGLRLAGSVHCWGSNNWGQSTDQAGPFTRVSAAGAHACALQSNGSVHCWGNNGYGEAIDQPGPFTRVSTGLFHTCGLRLDGSVDCWGRNDNGQAIDQPGPFIQISTGYYHTCGLRPDGSVHCWGSGSSGQSTDQAGPFTRISAGYSHTCGLRPDGSAKCWGSNWSGESTGATGLFTQIAAGTNHTCGMRPNGSVDCWGNGFLGQALDQPGPFTQVSAGAYHTCATRPDRSVHCWGNNGQGQAADQAGPLTQVSASSGHSCGLRPDGSLQCWGNIYWDQAAEHPGSFTQVSAAAFSTCALQPGGSVVCWGNWWWDPASGQDGPYTQISAGTYSVCGLRPGGSVTCWGDREYGLAADLPGPFSQVSTSEWQACALETNGSVHCWGQNDNWPASDHPGPYTQISTGYSHSCGLRPGGSVDCWGNNDYGQSENQAGPYTQISAGNHHTCALRTDGSIHCWGQGTRQAGPYGPYGSPVNPAPNITSLAPTSAQNGAAGLTLLVNGTGFMAGATVQWNGSALNTSFVSSSQLSALVPSALLGNEGVAYITATNPAPSAGPSAPMAFFITSSGVPVTGSDSSVSSGGTAAVSIGGSGPGTPGSVSSTATGGDGILTVAEYGGNPSDKAGFRSTNVYFDVHLSSGNTFSQVQMRFCHLSGGTQILWYDGSRWIAASDQTYDPTTGCITVVVNASTSPNLMQLSGTYFAGEDIPPSLSTLEVTPGTPMPMTQAAVQLAASFDSPAGALGAPYGVTISWGDGQTTSSQAGAPGAISGNHTYTAAGVYEVSVTVTDRNGGSGSQVFEYVVVYDPTGGFVTGGGWISSPAGAYVANPSLAGKANFGFVSRYQKGARVPEGNTQFQFQVATLEFHSTAYDWLVVAGAKAQYKGTGTINGEGNFGFMLSAIDGDINSDRGSDMLRIKIWDKDHGDALVYDNQASSDDAADPNTGIGGGSIVVHK